MTMSPKMFWSKFDVKRLEIFIKSKAKTLIPYFYRNIMEGPTRVRKYSGFYDEMARFLNRTSKQCKSKFQKFEEQIYTKYLGIPRKDFDLFKWVRSNKKKHKKIKNKFQKQSQKKGITEEVCNLAKIQPEKIIKKITNKKEEKLGRFVCTRKKFNKRERSSDLINKKDYTDKEIMDYWEELIVKIIEIKPREHPSRTQTKKRVSIKYFARLLLNAMVSSAINL